MSTLHLILDFVFRLAALLFLARFLLQASGADFYNPVSQAIVNATDPICRPLRAILRPIKRFDIASLFVAWLISMIFMALLVNWSAPGLAAVLTVLWAGLIRTLLVVTQFYLWTIIIVVIASFITQGTYHPALALLHQIIEPIMAPLRRVIPPLGPLDLTPMVVILIIYIIENMLRQAF